MLLGLVTKTNFDAKLRKISDSVTSNKSKHLRVENGLKKLKALDLRAILKAMMECKIRWYKIYIFFKREINIGSGNASLRKRSMEIKGSVYSKPKFYGRKKPDTK